MYLRSSVLTFLPLITSLACAASIAQSRQPLPKVRISRVVDGTLVSPSNHTIGDFFDSLLIENQGTLSERTVHRTQAITEVIWTDGSTNFNISMSRCVTMSDKAGLYTAKIGNLPNATVQDIVDDLQARGGSDAANRVEYSSRVAENAELAINEANNLLKVAVANYDPITPTEINTHGELRHLLALAEMIILIIRSSLTTEIVVALWSGVLGPFYGAAPQTALAICALTTFSIQMSTGILDIVQERPVNFVSATIFNIFLSWVRDSMRVFAGEFLATGTPRFLPSVAYDILVNGEAGNRTAKGSFADGSTWPLAQDLVKGAMGTLGYDDQPRWRFTPAAKVRPENTCPVPRI